MQASSLLLTPSKVQDEILHAEICACKVRMSRNDVHEVGQLDPEDIKVKVFGQCFVFEIEGVRY